MMRTILCCCVCLFVVAAGRAADEAPDFDPGWPRKIEHEGTVIMVYTPQVEKWEQQRLEAKAAVSVQTKAAAQPTYGVVWVSARAEVDKEKRVVYLDDMKITKSNFPKGDVDYVDMLKKWVPSTQRVVSLDRLQANIAVSEAEGRAKRVPLKNDAPKIYYSEKPAELVLVDGEAKIRQIEGSKLMRVINTRALILLDQANGKYYLHFLDRWKTADKIDGTWADATSPPASLDQAKKIVTEGGQQVDLLDDPSPYLKEALERGISPAVHVSTVPAELLQTQGKADMVPIDGTNVLWAKNSPDEILFEVNDQNYYVLLSGRWFRGKNLNGPWEFVAADKLPKDFAKIPATHPKGDVLASVTGTPDSKEAMIANSIPQTAIVKRSEAKASPAYDGEPKFEAIEGTKMQYAVNSATPIILVDNKYYACDNGVWFVSDKPNGPWAVATTIPAAIYSIPPSSPLYYVTHVYVYDSTPDVVYCGYTPGYFGTCVCPQNVVVFGTGWWYRPWIGSYWIGRPWSYGFAAGFRYTAAGGWGFGFAGWHAGGPWWGPYRGGWGARYNNIHATNINVNNFNVYNRWSKNTFVNQRTNVGVSRQATVTANRSLNNVYAGRDGNVYRRANEGWERNTTEGWKRTTTTTEGFRNVEQGLDRDFSGRRDGAARYDSFRSVGGYGGYGGARGGEFRGGGGRRR